MNRYNFLICIVTFCIILFIGCQRINGNDVSKNLVNITERNKTTSVQNKVLGKELLLENGVAEILSQDTKESYNRVEVPSVLEETLRWENSLRKENEMLVDSIVSNGELYYRFFKDEVTMLLPANRKDIYTIQKGDTVRTFNWLNNYEPGTKHWVIAKFVDVTGNGVNELCITLNLGSGTGVSVTGIHIVDVDNMEEIYVLDPEEYAALKIEDAMKVRDFLDKEKVHNSDLPWINNEIRIKWEQMNFNINDSGEITLTLGLQSFEQALYGGITGYIKGKYTYNGTTFELGELEYNPLNN